MTLDPIHCPKCGRSADGTLETLNGKALLYVIDEAAGVCDYEGETKVWWDEQTTVRDKRGRVTLLCENGHDWQATMTEGSK